MSVPDPVAGILVAAFFDAPGLLAVRFKHAGSAGRIVTFATQRRADAGPAFSFGGCGGIITVGLMVAFVGVPLLRSCGSGGSHHTTPAIADVTATDCKGRSDWSSHLSGLADDLSPVRPELQPWAVRTLLDVPREMARRGDPTGGWLKPRCATADRIAFSRGARLSAVLAEAGAGNDLAVILDLPGPQAVAAAAGMAARFEPVFTIDNLPHPTGVVPSAQTLAAVLYWRAEFATDSVVRAKGAAPVFVLEGDRLAPYHDEVGRFDNRSFARLPDAAGFKALGVTRILYVRPRSGDVVEADDLNVLFTALPADGVEIKHLALETLDQPPLAPPASPDQRTGDPAPAVARSFWFWQHYGWYRPNAISMSEIADQDARYRSQPRQTMFSSRPAVVSGLDGGQRARESVYNRLAPPPDVSEDGGSWSRSYGSSSG